MIPGDSLVAMGDGHPDWTACVLPAGPAICLSRTQFESARPRFDGAFYLLKVCCPAAKLRAASSICSPIIA